MKDNKISKALAIFVIIAGALVTAGWIFGVGVLKNILSICPAMELFSALIFFLSGFNLFFIARTQEKESIAAQVVIPIATLTTLLIMGTLLVLNVLKMPLGIDHLLTKEAFEYTDSPLHATPSTPSMGAFILIAAAGIFTMFDAENLKSKLFILGWVISILGGLAAAGHVLHVPILFYSTEGVSFAMSPCSSILFVIAGLSLVFLKSKGRPHEH